MHTTIVRLQGHRSQREAVEAAAETMRRGGIAVFPTETVYGLGTSAFATEGIRRIYRLKERQGRKPLQLLVHSLNSALPFVEEVPEDAKRLARALWPGPLTLVLKGSALGTLVTGGLGTVGLRVPRHPVAMSLLRCLGVPIAATSANLSGEPAITQEREALRQFEGRVNLILAGGASAEGRASTVVDLSDFPYTVKREGAISRHRIGRILEGRKR